MNRSCANCRFHSEVIAKAAGGMVWAMCLNPKSVASGSYQRDNALCDHHERGLPVDLDQVPLSQRQRSIQAREAAGALEV